MYLIETVCIYILMSLSLSVLVKQNTKQTSASTNTRNSLELGGGVNIKNDDIVIEWMYTVYQLLSQYTNSVTVKVYKYNYKYNFKDLVPPISFHGGHSSGQALLC